MSRNYGKVDSMGLGFFGSMTASISHEVKNALAVINENAGLLGDLVMLAEKGRPLDPARIQTISANILRRVNLADEIIRKLNRFAHSAQQPVVSSNVRDILETTISLAARLADMKGVSLTIEPGETFEIQTIPFVLENLLWLCLKNLLATVSGAHQAVFSVESEETDVVVSLRMSPDLPIAQIESATAAEAQPLLLFLRIHLTADVEHSRLRLRMPKKFIE